MRLTDHAARWIGGGAILALLAYFHACMLSRFWTGEFSFHDLTLINDLLDNGAFFGRPFWVSDYQLEHFQVHFTPSLALLIPLKRIFTSQFWLVAANIWASVGAAILGSAVLRHFLPKNIGATWREALLGLFAVFLSTSLFFRTVLASAHFEVFYLPAALGTMLLMIRRAPWPILAIAVAGTLGIRQDAGFFLAFQCLALALLSHSRESRGEIRRRAAVVGALSLLYVVIAVKGLMPLWGRGESTGLWESWGSTWPEVFWTMLTSPVRLFGKTVHASACGLLNASFGLLPALSPLAGIVANLPGFLFYAASNENKAQLADYNAAFVLPGIVLASAAGIASVARYRPAMLAITAILAGGVVSNVIKLEFVQAHTPEISSHPVILWHRPSGWTYSGVREALLAARVARGGSLVSVATDFRSIVFVPGGYERLLLRNSARADVVLLREGASLFMGESGVDGEASLSRIVARLESDPGLTEIKKAGLYRVFVRDAARPSKK